MKRILFLLGAFVFLFSAEGVSQERNKLLVFTKTNGFVHESISAGKAALIEAGNAAGIEVDTTSDANYFRQEKLAEYKAVVFLNTTGDILNSEQQAAFENYIRAGGGFAGIHSAADTEYEWPWYGKMVGGYFQSHPHIQSAEISVVNRKHPATRHLPKKWEREDEWYNYKNINPQIEVLATLNESSYEGGENGAFHPIAWYQHYDGGRAFYTGGGHTSESYQQPDFLKHVIQGILWAGGIKPITE
ncbi:ThuA domain-containing protein [Salinimicrobium oceani]|uniref:ThuA domain-containing protein n=1 Tax=Salinimicrobium oceani TaxID=2722702 RepID=A0ABX1CZR1_9FLAO|nr:ThuA domain-containing protein [Salinimicrobium oceani]NJW53755.1 ThuA domain-containing protein [Salinimicrobium oceani]